MQHMHIVESQNPYLNFNFGHLGSNLANDSVQTTQLSPLIRSNMMPMISTNGENHSRAACALHCSLCNHTFTNRTQLMSHNIAHSTENLELSCDNENIDICDNSNQVPQNLSYERSINSVDNSIQNLSYQRSTTTDNNEIQNLSFPENIDLEEVQSNSPPRVQNTFTKDLECTDNREDIDRYRLCPPNLNYKQQIGEENSEDVQSKKYKCQVCLKLFSQKSKLITHQLSHSGQQPFKCQTCEKAYSSKNKLNAHMRLHTKINVHQCKMCDKVFSYPSYLQEHLKTHNQDSDNMRNEERNFECLTCKKRFRLLKNLRAHERLHTGKGLLQCDICDKRFSQNYNLKVHLRTHKTTRSIA